MIGTVGRGAGASVPEWADGSLPPAPVQAGRGGQGGCILAIRALRCRERREVHAARASLLADVRVARKIQCVKRQGDMAEGTVKWFNATKGYGFLTPDDGSSDVFVHYSAIEGSGYRELFEGQRVDFESSAGQKGPQATKVRAL